MRILLLLLLVAAVSQFMGLKYVYGPRDYVYYFTWETKSWSYVYVEVRTPKLIYDVGEEIPLSVEVKVHLGLNVSRGILSFEIYAEFYWNELMRREVNRDVTYSGWSIRFNTSFSVPKSLVEELELDQGYHDIYLAYDLGFTEIFNNGTEKYHSAFDFVDDWSHNMTFYRDTPISIYYSKFWDRFGVVMLSILSIPAMALPWWLDSYITKRRIKRMG